MANLQTLAPPLPWEPTAAVVQIVQLTICEALPLPRDKVKRIKAVPKMCNLTARHPIGTNEPPKPTRPDKDTHLLPVCYPNP